MSDSDIVISVEDSGVGFTAESVGEVVRTILYDEAAWDWAGTFD